MAAHSDIISFESMPVGCRFQPTEEECLTYLKRRICGNQRYLHVIPELNVYDCDPGELPQKFRELSIIQSKDQEWWFICPLQYTTSSRSKIRRKTKSGYWKKTGEERIVKSKKDEQIGVMRTLVFRHNCDTTKVTDWVMHEYRLMDKGIFPNQDDFALYRVMKRSDDVSNEFMSLDSDDKEAEHMFPEETIQAKMKSFSDLLVQPLDNHSLASQSHPFPQPDEFDIHVIRKGNPECEHNSGDDDYPASLMQIDLEGDSGLSNETLTEVHGQEKYQINQSRQDYAIMKAPSLATTPLKTSSTYSNSVMMPTPPSPHCHITYGQTSNHFIYLTPSSPETQSLITTFSPLTPTHVPVKDYFQNPITQDVIPIGKEYLKGYTEKNPVETFSPLTPTHVPIKDYFQNPVAQDVIPIEKEYSKGYTEKNPVDIITKFFPEEFNFQPTDPRKNRMFYEFILVDTDSVEITHSEKEGAIAFSACKIKKIVTPEQWNQQPWMSKKFTQPFVPQVYDYYDYIKAWEVVFLMRNYSHCWYFQFSKQFVKDFPSWFITWFGHYGLTEKIFPEKVYAVYELFNTYVNEPSYVKLLKFSAEFSLGWVLSWNYVIEPGQFGQTYVKRSFRVKWWEKSNAFE